MSFMELGFRKPAKKTYGFETGGDLTSSRSCKIWQKSVPFLNAKTQPPYSRWWSCLNLIIFDLHRQNHHFLPQKICHKDARHLISLSLSLSIGLDVAPSHRDALDNRLLWHSSKEPHGNICKIWLYEGNANHLPSHLSIHISSGKTAPKKKHLHFQRVFFHCEKPTGFSLSQVIWNASTRSSKPARYFKTLRP